MGVMQSRVQQAWTALRHCLGRLRALGPEYARLELDGTHDGLGCLRKWRPWLEEAYTPDQGAVYRWLKDESWATPVTFLSRPAGTATANLAEMDGLL